jgi:siroheme synthase (precorrin-2 oxidase/ferrochelatase)
MKKEKKVLKIPSQIGKIETMADKGLKVVVYTQELTSEDKALILELQNMLGWFVFSEAELEPEDLVSLPKIKAEFRSEKTPSERLRAVLYVYWDQASIKTPFDDFYKKYIENLIEKIKEKINP